jgi:hypothetical protein
MCLCEEARRSNLLFIVGFLSPNLLQSLNLCTIPTCFEEHRKSNNRLLRRASSQRHIYFTF